MAVGDSLGGQKADGRLVDRALSAAVGKGARQFILVTPLGGGAANPIGFLGNLFGGGSSKKPSKIEQQVEFPATALHEARSFCWEESPLQAMNMLCSATSCSADKMRTDTAAQRLYSDSIHSRA